MDDIQWWWFQIVIVNSKCSETPKYLHFRHLLQILSSSKLCQVSTGIKSINKEGKIVKNSHNQNKFYGCKVMPRLNKTPNKDIKYYIKYKIKKWNISFMILDFQRFAIEFRERSTQTSYLLRPVEDWIQFCKSVSNLYSCMIGWVFSRKMKLCGIEQKGATSQANTSIVLRSWLWSRHPFWLENYFCHIIFFLQRLSSCYPGVGVVRQVDIRWYDIIF